LEPPLPTDNAYLSFDVPGGRLAFADGDLDLWAEHLAWCYRMMGIPDGATIAVQDFGSSPISFLGSSLLMPGLRHGVAERIDGRFICLDASAERVTLTPALLAQLPVDALVIREDVLELLSAELRKRGTAALSERAMKTIVVFGDEPPPPNPARLQPSRHFMHVESALLLAPQCVECDCFHLRQGFYQVDGRVVRNLHLAVPAYELSRGQLFPPSHCAAGIQDWCIGWSPRGQGI
jgi:hypothetical protein